MRVLLEEEEEVSMSTGDLNQYSCLHFYLVDVYMFSCLLDHLIQWDCRR
jgi:hypothetical protein